MEPGLGQVPEVPHAPPKRALAAAAISVALLGGALLSGALLGGASRLPLPVGSGPGGRSGGRRRLLVPLVLRLKATVVAGDSAYRIARRHGVGLQDLLKVNGMSAKTVLRPGMVLRIPPIVISAALAARLPRPLLARPERLRLVRGVPGHRPLGRACRPTC